MKLPFSRKKKIQMPSEIREQVLRNVLARCGREPGSIPLETLDSYANYRAERHDLTRAFIVLILVAFLLLPVLFLRPTLSVRERAGTLPNRRAYSVTVDTVVPILKMEAEMNGRVVPLYESAGTQFLAVPSENGVMNLKVTLRNHQYETASVTVTGVDIDPPKLAGSTVAGDLLYVYLTDASGIDYENITLTDDSGRTYPVVSFDARNGRVVLNYPDRPSNLRVPDIYGTTLDVRLDVK